MCFGKNLFEPFECLGDGEITQQFNQILLLINDEKPIESHDIDIMIKIEKDDQVRQELRSDLGLNKYKVDGIIKMVHTHRTEQIKVKKEFRGEKDLCPGVAGTSIDI